MAEVSNDDNINVVTVTATLVKPPLPILPSFYDKCINHLELSLAHDKDCFRKLKADMNDNVDNNATYINVCNHQKLMILTRCISSVQLLPSRFYRIRLNESISASRSFLWDDNLQQGCVKSTFRELGLPFIYCPLLPSSAGNLCYSCYNTFNSTDGDYPLPLCTKCVGTYNGPHLAPISNEYKGYEKHMNAMQHNLRSDSDSDSGSNFTTTAEEHSDNTSLPGLSIRNVDSDNKSRTTSDNDDDDSVASSFSFVYDLNVDMYNNEDVHELDVVDTGTHYFTSAMDTVSEENEKNGNESTTEHENKCGSVEKSNINNPAVSFYCNCSFTKSVCINCNSNDSDSCHVIVFTKNKCAEVIEQDTIIPNGCEHSTRSFADKTTSSSHIKKSIVKNKSPITFTNKQSIVKDKSPNTSTNNTSSNNQTTPVTKINYSNNNTSTNNSSNTTSHNSTTTVTKINYFNNTSNASTNNVIDNTTRVRKCKSNTLNFLKVVGEDDINNTKVNEDDVNNTKVNEITTNHIDASSITLFQEIFISLTKTFFGFLTVISFGYFIILSSRQ